MPDDILIARWQQGDESSFDILYRRYISTLVEVLTRKIGCLQTAKELAQDVFLAVYLQKSGLAEIACFKAYLLSIARNKVFNHYRSQLVREKYREHFLMNVDGDAAEEVYELIENKELEQILSQQINELPPKCREVFRMSREERLPYKSIAEQMSISENTVDQHIQKALRIIRATLKEYRGGITGILILVLLLCVQAK